MSMHLASRVEELITYEELRPGDRLPPERELAAMLGVSRPSLREAIQSLAAQGKLSVRRGKGVFVEPDSTTKRLRKQLTEQALDLDELYDMREVLEVPAAGWAADHGDRKAVKRLIAAYDALQAAASEPQPDWQRLQRLDAAFHEAVVRSAGNRFMLRTVGVLSEIMETGMQTTLRLPGRLESSARDHERIMRAIQAHDAKGARAASKAHIRAARRAARRSPAE